MSASLAARYRIGGAADVSPCPRFASHISRAKRPFAAAKHLSINKLQKCLLLKALSQLQWCATENRDSSCSNAPPDRSPQPLFANVFELKKNMQYDKRRCLAKLK